MFNYIKKVINARKAEKDKAKNEGAGVKISMKLFSSLDKNLDMFKEKLGTSSDFVMKEFCFGCDHYIKGALLCIDGLVNMDLISNAVLKPLMFDTTFKLSVDKSSHLDFESMNPDFISTGEVKKISDLEDILHDLLSGNTIILVNGSTDALSIGTRKWDKRSVAEPETENVVRGPRQAFTETLRTNTSMIRRILKNENLRLEMVKVGKQTKTDILHRLYKRHCQARAY